MSCTLQGCYSLLIIAYRQFLFLCNFDHNGIISTRIFNLIKQAELEQWKQEQHNQSAEQED